jgi:hypothetical protein
MTNESDLARLRRLDENLRRINADMKAHRVSRFRYRNYKGEVAVRLVAFISIDFDSDRFHTEPQWLALGRDMEKKQDRTFAVADILEWLEETP